MRAIVRVGVREASNAPTLLLLLSDSVQALQTAHARCTTACRVCTDLLPIAGMVVARTQPCEAYSALGVQCVFNANHKGRHTYVIE